MPNFAELIAVCDGMVARGDSSIEISLANMFLSQKAIIAPCSRTIKLVISATKMLQSMIKKNNVPLMLKLHYAVG